MNGNAALLYGLIGRLRWDLRWLRVDGRREKQTAEGEAERAAAAELQSCAAQQV